MANTSCAPLHLDRPAAELAADDERQAALSRQSDELEALSALFSADGESVSIEESGNGELSCTLTLQQHGASLSIALPELYPTSVPPRLAVSIPALRASLHSELVNELAEIASAGVADDHADVSVVALLPEAAVDAERADGDVSDPWVLTAGQDELAGR